MDAVWCATCSSENFQLETFGTSESWVGTLNRSSASWALASELSNGQRATTVFSGDSAPIGEKNNNPKRLTRSVGSDRAAAVWSPQKTPTHSYNLQSRSKQVCFTYQWVSFGSGRNSVVSDPVRPEKLRRSVARSGGRVPRRARLLQLLYPLKVPRFRLFRRHKGSGLVFK